MNIARTARQLAIGITLSVVVTLGLPATGMAYGYYHYVAWDTYRHNTWPSKMPIKRLYWHHTNGGIGATIKMDVGGVPVGWVWFPLHYAGAGEWVGTADQLGWHMKVTITRFNGKNGGFDLVSINDALAWSRNAWVQVSVEYGSWSIGYAEGFLYYRDQNW